MRTATPLVLLFVLTVTFMGAACGSVTEADAPKATHATRTLPPPVVPRTQAVSADAPTAKGSRSHRMVLQAGGDVAYPKGGPLEDLCEQQGAALFRDLAPLLADGDVNFLNLESPFSDAPLSSTADHQFAMVSPPHRLLWLADAGFNLFSLANNHALDASVAGVSDTIAALRRAARIDRPIWFNGAKESLRQRPVPLFFQPPGKHTRIGFVAVWRNGSALVPSARGPIALQLIREAAAHSDVVVVSVHDGDEYQHVPPSGVAARNRAYIDAGARVVLGHHAHVAQGIERYRDGVIFHGLGNLSFASLTTRHQQTGAEFLSLFVRIVLTHGSIHEVRAYPLFVGNGHPLVVGDTSLPPRFASPQLLRGALAKYALERIIAWSEAIPGHVPTQFQIMEDSLVVLGQRAAVSQPGR